jgi:glycosyltransferase involved in cell wall biosynthesis
MASMSDQPLVSVIIPVYNGAEFIADAVESATTQTYRNLEIIVVDDGSRDSSLEIVRSLASKDDRIRIIAQPNGGVAKARNTAIAAAKGEFIAPLDADDLWLPAKIERQMARMSADGDECGFVYTWWATIDPAGKVLDRSPRWTVAGERFDTLLLINFTGNASAPLFRKRCLVEAGGYNPKLAAAKSGGCEDYEVALRVAARYRIGVVSEILMGYRRSPGSMSSNCDMMWRSRQMVIDGLAAYGVVIRPRVLQDSDRQFCMYLAALSFWSGKVKQAIRWGLRSGVRRPLLFAPYLLKMTLMPRPKEQHPLVMRPGKSVDTSSIPEPLLPFNRILSLQ